MYFEIRIFSLCLNHELSRWTNLSKKSPIAGWIWYGTITVVNSGFYRYFNYLKHSWPFKLSIQWFVNLIQILRSTLYVYWGKLGGNRNNFFLTEDPFTKNFLELTKMMTFSAKYIAWFLYMCISQLSLIFNLKLQIMTKNHE